MMRLLRRLVLLGAMAGVGYSAYRVWLRRRSSPLDAPQWPPMSGEPRLSKIAETVADSVVEPVVEPAPLWVVPVNGACPDGYPLKANDNSRIFHAPGGRFYTRTVAERCYASAHDAVADGYRPAKA